jgi:hypothetical protein
MKKMLLFAITASFIAVTGCSTEEPAAGEGDIQYGENKQYEENDTDLKNVKYNTKEEKAKLREEK